MDELRYDGRVAIVTGAGSGLGRAYAKLLAGRGAQVVVNDLGLRRSPDSAVHPAEETVAEIADAGGQAVAHLGDVSSDADVDQLVRRAIDTFGRIDIVINNAGIDAGIPFSEVTRDDLERYLRVHVVGSFLVTKAAWPHMAEQGYGRVVLTSSSAVLGLEKRAHYTAAKGGVFGLMRTLAAEGRPYGINVNGLWPLGTTPMAKEAFAEAALPEEHQRALEAAADVDLVTPVVAWLVHEDCESTGETIHAACGKVARVFMAQGPGISDRDLTVESLRDRWREVLQDSPHTVLSHALESTAWAFSGE